MFTSAELSSLVYKTPVLLDSIMNVYEKQLVKLGANPSDKHTTMVTFSVLHDLKYMSSTPSTKVLPKLIEPLHHLYFLDKFKPRTSMIEFMQLGSFNEPLLNIEFYIFKIVESFSPKIDYLNDT